MSTYNFSLYHKFLEIAKSNKNKIALQYPDGRSYSFGEISRLAEGLAEHFYQKGIRKGDLICIMGDKVIEDYVTILASLKIGSIYTFLDPKSPIARLEKILVKCSPKAIISKHFSGLESFISNTNCLTINKNSLLEAVNNKRNFESQLTGDNAAYVMFTSGSTGIPKGATISHDNVLKFIEWAGDEFEIDQFTVATAINPIYFDNSVYDFYANIFNGATLVVFRQADLEDPFRLVEIVKQYKCSHWFSVPSLLIYLQGIKAIELDNTMPLRKIIFGGEGFPKSKLKKLIDCYSEKTKFYNVYGPTECTCICSSYEIDNEDFKDINGYPPIGKLANNFDLFLLNSTILENGDTKGELFLMGPGVGKGYYKDQLKSEEVFIQNPTNLSYREFGYKTGDIFIQKTSDGKLYFSHRKDNQIKHMGYRIELEEIELAANSINFIKEAAAIHVSSNEVSKIYLVVGVDSKDGELAPKIKDNLIKQLPAYMVPSKIISMENLPKNQNGKIDRISLKMQIERLSQ